LEEEEKIAADLRFALEHDHIKVHYQPKISLADGQILGAEALVRWNHPTLGEIPPERFLEVAAERGLMPDLGDRITDIVAGDIAQWRKVGISPGPVAINIHAVDLKSPQNLIERLDGLSRHGVSRSDVVLEITEGCFVGRGTDHASMLIDTLHELGFELSLDDFGTGHAALSHLKSLPVSEVKIDRSFVMGLGVNRHDSAIVTAIVALAQGLGLRIVAEGVETEEHRKRLLEMGVVIGQGYLWSHALGADAFCKLVAGHDALKKNRARGVS